MMKIPIIFLPFSVYQWEQVLLFQPELPYLLPGMESRWPTGLRDRETGNRSGNAEKRIRLLTEQSVGRRFFYSESPVAKRRRNGLLAG